jgi:predicted SAM-dependent methyltransferase
MKVKLHVGCGKRFIEGYIHIDLMDYPHIDYKTSVDNLSMFKDNSVDVIYACHLLEHFKRGETEKVLKEWYRVLKKGGILRISVPDFRQIVKIYQQYDLNTILGPVMGRQDYQYNFHYMIFDFETLSHFLTTVGFKGVATFDWRKTEHAGVDDYSQAYIPHMDKENGIQVSLNVEAIK